MGCSSCGKNNPPQDARRHKVLQDAKLERDARKGDVQEGVVRLNEPKTPKTPNLAKKAANLAKSMVSRGVTNKRAEPVTKRLRVLGCHGNPDHLDSPCPYRKLSNKKRDTYLCDACGCGDHAGAWLNNPGQPDAFTKLDYPWLSCPMGMPGFSDYIPYGEESEDMKKEYGESLKRKKIVEDLSKVLDIDIPKAIPKPSEEEEVPSEEND